jgi:hypothetical protein
LVKTLARWYSTVRGAQLDAGISTAAPAPQPLAVQQVRPGKFRTEAGAAKPPNRRTVKPLGVVAVADQRA